MLTPKKVSCLNLVSIPDIARVQPPPASRTTPFFFVLTSIPDIHQDPSWVSKLALPEDPKKWTIDQVCEWASTVIKSEHAQKLKPQEIDGAALLGMNYEKFREYGIPGGPATNLIEAIKTLNPQNQGKLFFHRLNGAGFWNRLHKEDQAAKTQGNFKVFFFGASSNLPQLHLPYYSDGCNSGDCRANSGFLKLTQAELH